MKESVGRRTDSTTNTGTLGDPVQQQQQQKQQQRNQQGRLVTSSTQTTSFTSSSFSSFSSSSSKLFKNLVKKSRMCAMVPKRYLRLALVTCLMVSMVLIYVTLFKHPPPEQLLKMNGGNKDFNLRAVFGDIDSWDNRNGPVESGGSSRDLRVREAGDPPPDENDADGADDVKRKHSPVDDKHKHNAMNDKDDVSIWDMLEHSDDDDDDKKLSHDDGRDANSDKRRKRVNDDVKQSNSGESRRKTGDGVGERGDEHGDNDGDKNGDRKIEGGGGMKGKAAWDKFTSINKFTVIGIVLDRCVQPSEQLGTVILLEDKENGGVKSRTYYNFTLEEDLSEGTFSIDVKYNGQDLYDNYWDVCEMEEDLEMANRTFICPIKKGRQCLIKEKHVPSYLPKGHYQSKGWVKDAKDRVILCGFSDFRL